MSAARPVVFSPDLEQAALSAIIAGKLPLSTVKPEELSKEGRTVHEAVRVLQAASGESELPYRSVLVAAVDKLGADRKTLREYLKAVRKTRSGAEVDEVLRSVRNRQAVVSLIDECTEQLGTGNFDLATLAGKLAGKLAVGTGGTLVPVSELVKSGIPESPRGLVFGQLPELSRVSGGLMKLWVIGGEPKIGKSTLALQLALYASQHIPVLYYDFENGQDTMVFHLYEALGKDIAKLQRVTGNLFLRDSIRTLETDMAVLKPPALIVVDSLQKLPTRADERRTGLDGWIRKFELIKQKGYTVLILSELNREGYQNKKGSSRKFSYKDTGEVEYSCDFGVELKRSRKDDDIIEVHVTANRHYPFRGHVTDLERVNNWMFTEVTSYAESE